MLTKIVELKVNFGVCEHSFCVFALHRFVKAIRKYLKFLSFCLNLAFFLLLFTP